MTQTEKPGIRTVIFLVTTALVGMLASAELVLSEIAALRDPAAALGCDLNPLIGCSSSLLSWQAHLLFGVPNALLGTAAFAAAAAILASWLGSRRGKARGANLRRGTPTKDNSSPATSPAASPAALVPGPPKWLVLSLEAGLTASLGLVVFFLYYSVTEFRTLCPYCSIVWVATILLWVHLGAVLAQLHWLPGSLNHDRFAQFWLSQRWLITAIALLLIVLVVAVTLSDKLVYLF